MSNGKIAQVLCRNLKKRRNHSRGGWRGQGTRGKKRKERWRHKEEVWGGEQSRGSTVCLETFVTTLFTVHWPHLPFFFNISSSLVQNALYFMVFDSFLRSEFNMRQTRVMRDEIRLPRNFHLHTYILISWIITAPQSCVFGSVTDSDSPFFYSVSYRQTKPTMLFLSSTVSALHRANYAD